MAISHKLSIKHLLFLAWSLAVLLLVALLVDESWHDEQQFMVRHAAAKAAPGDAVELTLQGENFHPGIKGVLAANLGNEQARLWQLLPAIPTRNVALRQGLALVSCYGRRLVSFGLQAGEPPQLRGSLELPDIVNQIEMVGELALVALTKHAGLALVDLQEPDELRLLAHYPLDGLVTSMVARRGSIYYADLFQGVGRLDLTAQEPFPEALVALESPWSLALQGERLAVGSLKEGVHLFDIDRDGRLARVGTLAAAGDLRGVALTDEVLAVAFADGTLQVYDVAAWPSLGEPHSLLLPGRPFQLEPVPGRARLAVSLSSGGVVLVDIDRPAAPRLGNHFKTPATFLGMQLRAGELWAATREGLEVFALDAIESEWRDPLPTEARLDREQLKLQGWNGRIYGLRGRLPVDLGAAAGLQGAPPNRPMALPDGAGVNFYGQAEPGRLEKLGVLPMVGGAADALWRDDTLYVLSQKGLRVFSGASAEQLIMIGELVLSERGGRLATLASGHLLVANAQAGLEVVDVSDPRRPLSVGRLAPQEHLQPSGYTYGLLVDGDRAFVSQGSGGVQVIDVRNPAQPRLRQLIRTPGVAKSMAFHEGLLLVSDTSQGIFLIDASDRKDARPLGSWPLPVRIEQLAVAGDRLIVSNHLTGTWQLPLPQRLRNLEVVDNEELRVRAEGFATAQYVYLYDGQTVAQTRVGAP